VKLALFADPGSPHTRVWLDALRARGVDVHLFSAQKASPPSDLGVPVATPAGRPNDAPKSGARARDPWQLRRISRAVRLAPGARAWVRALRPDLTLALRLQPEGLLAAMSGARPLVLVSWGQDVLHLALRHPLHRAFARFAVRRAARVYGETENVLDGWRRLGAPTSRAMRALTGIDTEFWKSRGQTAAVSPLPARFILSPRALAARGHQRELTRAWLEVTAQQDGDLGLVLTGHGDPAIREECRALASAAGRLQDLFDLGSVEPSALRALFDYSTLVASLWRPDGLSQTLLEAMAAGAVPLVADLPGTREWIDEGVNGVLVDPSDVPAVARALRRALALPREAVAEENRRRVSLHADRERNMDRWIDELRQLASSQATR